MYERLLDKNVKPTIEEFMAHIGIEKELFENIDVFLMNELDSGKILKIGAHDRCWQMSYHRKRKYICDIISEKNSFTVVTRLSEENLKQVYDDVLPYTKDCIDNSPYRHRGWVEYRVLNTEHLKDAKLILQVRVNNK